MLGDQRLLELEPELLVRVHPLAVHGRSAAEARRQAPPARTA